MNLVTCLETVKGSTTLKHKKNQLCQISKTGGFKITNKLQTVGQLYQSHSRCWAKNEKKKKEWWVAAFLLGRSQFVQIGSFSSLPKHLNGGIPQGTKLAPLLFAIMVNDLVNDWRLRAKFVDDLTLLEVHNT